METVFRHIRFEEMPDLEQTHPLVHGLGKRGEHAPTFFPLLADCPDIEPGFPCYYYLTRKDRIIASLSTIPDTMTAKGQSYKWAWTGSFLADPTFRGEGLGSRLWGRALEVLGQDGYIMAGAFANPVTTHICRKMGFTIPDRAARLVFLKSADPFIKERINSRFARSLLDLPYKVAVRGWRLASWAIFPSYHGAKTPVVQLTPDRGDDPPHTGRLEYEAGLHFNDTRPKLLWKMRSAKNSRLLLASDRVESRDLYYMVISDRFLTKKLADRYSDFQLMTLMDYGWFDLSKRTMQLMLSHLMELFWQSDAQVLEVITSSRRLEKAAKARGFIRAGQGVAFWFKAPPGIDLGPEAEDIHNWHFTHFVTDAFSFS